MFIKKSKFLVILGALSIASPIVSLSSCGIKDDKWNDDMVSTDAQNLLKQWYYHEVIKKEFGDMHEAKIKQVWNIWAANKMIGTDKDKVSDTKQDFWLNLVNKIKNEGNYPKGSFNMNDGWLSFSSKEITSDKPDSGFFPSWKLAKRLLGWNAKDGSTKHKNLFWMLQINQILGVYSYFTSVTPEQLESGDDKYFKSPQDYPSLFRRGAEEEGGTIAERKEAARYFFLNKYLVENKPTQVWHKESTNLAHATNIPVRTVNKFNNLDHSSLLSFKQLPVWNVVDKRAWLNKKGTLSNSQLTGYKGFSKIDVNKGEMDYEKTMLKRRNVDGTASKEGFVNEDGNITNTGIVTIKKTDKNKNNANKDEEKKTGKETKGQLTYVRQFLPYFHSFNRYSTSSVTEPNDHSKVMIVDRKNYTMIKVNKTDFEGTSVVASNKDINKKYKYSSKKWIEVDFSHNTTGWLQMKFGKNTTTHDPVLLYVGIIKHQQEIQDMAYTQKELDWYKNNYSVLDVSKYTDWVDEYSSYFSAEKWLLDNKYHELDTLIANLALSNKALITKAQEWMTDYLGYTFTTINNDRLKDIFKKTGIYKEK